MKKVNITITPSTEAQVKDLFDTQKGGLETAIESYLVMRKPVLDSIRELFGREELVALLDLHNGTMMNAKFTSPELLARHLEEAEELEATCTRHGADLENMKTKILGLTHPQSLYLIHECYRFWYTDLYGNDFEKFRL